jgi:hypothetical protein
MIADCLCERGIFFYRLSAYGYRLNARIARTRSDYNYVTVVSAQRTAPCIRGGGDRGMQDLNHQSM